MTNPRQPPLTVEKRLTRLETLFSNVGETVLAQSDVIAAMSASIQQTNQNVRAQSDVIRMMSLLL
ncbi:hypothetical protein [Scytonema sp. UIC 10036]|uniref:hypothetical protein n=1 Tax=Scytonema sp. UIC 10036 TaxID=2304196 RepID=UPI001FAAD890|nr:hypothetical protein [Scytonema sp. UIC 10036]